MATTSLDSTDANGIRVQNSGTVEFGASPAPTNGPRFVAWLMRPTICHLNQSGFMSISTPFPCRRRKSRTKHGR